MFEQLKANILAQLATLLPDLPPLAFSIELDRNKNGKSSGYAVTIGDATATNDTVGRSTLLVTVEVKLMRPYTPSNNSDSGQLTASLQLADQLITVFEGLAAAKLGTPGVRMVNLESISEPTYLTDEKTVSRTLTIAANIKVP